MVGNKVRILLIEDEPGHILLCQHALTAERYDFDVKVATTGKKALEILQDKTSSKPNFDIVVLDNKLPDYYGFELLGLIRTVAPDKPVIFVTGYKDDELAVEALRRGAIDYLPKTQDYHKHLPRIIQLNIERNTLYASIKKLHELETRYRLLIETAQDAIFMLDQEGRIQLANRIAERTFGYLSEELLGKTFILLLPDRVVAPYLERAIEDGKLWLLELSGRTIELTGLHRDGQEFPIELSLSSCEINGQVAFTAIVRDIRERKRFSEALRTLNSKLVRAQEEERKKISRELHDEVGQALATINIGLQLIRDKVPENNKRIVDELETAIDDIKNVIRSLRELSALLHPHILDDLGLTSAIRWLVGEISSRSSISIDLNIPNSPTRYAPDIELTLFRICQEALTNVIKHARADKVQIVLEKNRMGLKLEVEDNGRGFKIEEKTKLHRGSGLGIVGMKERVVSVGGQFSITSLPKKGTKISVTIPVVHGSGTHRRLKIQSVDK
ncbi:MAG: PAS domain S-box protein [Blastocatellia bacterium]|nr:PAS domain S-box protein [Blastocatellia bacterium]